MSFWWIVLAVFISLSLSGSFRWDDEGRRVLFTPMWLVLILAIPGAVSRARQAYNQRVLEAARKTLAAEQQQAAVTPPVTACKEPAVCAASSST
jgi:hypothetical protein